MRCKVERQILAWLLGLAGVLGIPHASAAQDEGEFVLRCSSKEIHGIVRRHGLTLLRSHESQDIHLVRAPATPRPEHFLSDLRSPYLTSPATCLASPRSSPIWASPRLPFWTSPRLPFWTNPRPPSWTKGQSSS